MPVPQRPAASRILARAAFWAVAGLACSTPPAIAATRTALPSPYTSLADGNFENPPITAASIVQHPAPGAWTFNGPTGYASNNSAYNNPAAPSGTQVAYINGNGSNITQNFTATAGSYRLQFKAVQRPNNAQSIRISVDGSTLDTVVPPTGNFADFTYDLGLTAGTHTLTFTGITTGDHTAFLDSITLQQLGFLPNGSLETPNIGAGQIFQHPVGSGWTFYGTTGFASNGSAFGNPPATEGSQVLYLMGHDPHHVTQAFTVPTAARYRLQLDAAQRANNTQSISVRIDGVEVERLTPQSENFRTYILDAIKLSAGTHTLELHGQSTDGHTAFVDNVRLLPVVAAARAWSNPATWGGTLPASGDTVVIPSGSTVLLDMPSGASQTSVSSIAVDGELHCSDSNIAMFTGTIKVSGRFVCGSPHSPYINTFDLVLGEVLSNSRPSNPKSFMVHSPGVLELHGESRTSWTRLAETAEAGANQIRVAANTNWRLGDTLVLAPTREKVDEAETVVITSINAAGTTIGVSGTSPTNRLRYRHYGQTQTYSSGSDSWVLDERGEVGLLSRNIRIRGDDGAPATGIGGHIMSMQGTTVRASGIELYRMGQKGVLARYPFHWHLVHDAPGQYIRNSSVHQSYNRCITVHQTNYARVADNVCYDFIGHGYFLEAGNEQFNEFDGNLGIRARKPSPTSQAVLETDYRSSGPSNGPAVFWISHPNNSFTGNVAAGSEGSGFWYHLADCSMVECEAPATTPPPILADFGRFDGNRVHSSRQGFSSCLFASGMAGIDKPGAVLNDLMVNHTEQAIWPCAGQGHSSNSEFRRTIVANSRNGMQAANPMTFTDSLFVAYSANEPPLASPAAEIPWFAISLYDQGFLLDGAHFVNYHRPNMSLFLNSMAAHKVTANRSRRLSFENSPNRFIDLNDASTPGNATTEWGDVIHDLDGSLIGTANLAVVTDHPLLSDASCFRPPGSGIEGYVCPYRYAAMRFDFEGVTSNASPRMTILRSDGVQDTVEHRTFGVRFMHQFIADGPYRHSYRFDDGIHRNKIAFWALNGFEDDTSIHEILDMPASFYFREPSGWTPVFSLPDLLASPRNHYFYRPESASLFLNIGRGANRPDWFANELLEICMVPWVADFCPLSYRYPAPPKVTITSPATAIVTPPGQFFTVQASISSPTPITWTRLFMNDVEVGSANAGTNPYNYSIRFNGIGNYVLKLVARNDAGHTYTALQTVRVGEPAPRLEITNLLDKGTYAFAQVPNLQFQQYRGDLLPAGAHVHWLDNTIDKGDASSGAVSLAGLDQGKHELQVAVANSDQSLKPIHDRKTIYVMRDGVLADFEDGVDERGTVVVTGYTTPGLIQFEKGVPRLSRNDGEDDNIWYYLPIPTLPYEYNVIYRMQIQPAQNWSSFQKIRIVHSGAGFELFVRYANAGWISLGSAPPITSPGQIRTPEFTLFPSPLLPSDQVTGLELRHRDVDMGCSLCSTERLWEIKLLP